jgi:hypothetical protein
VCSPTFSGGSKEHWAAIMRARRSARSSSVPGARLPSAGADAGAAAVTDTDAPACPHAHTPTRPRPRV